MAPWIGTGESIESLDRLMTEIRFRTNNGMVFERTGAGRPVVLLHGWCLNRRLWMYEEEKLAATCDVFGPDLAGFGSSDALSAPYTFARYGDDIADLLRELELRDAVLVGFAFGAVVAVELARRPELRLAGVVAVAIPSAAYAPYERMPAAMRRDWPDFCRRSARALFHAPPSEATLGWVESMFMATPLRVAIETVALMAALDPSTLAADVMVPQLFIHAADDSVSPRAVGEACLARAPRARLAVVENCGHAIPLEQKTRFHEILNEFLAEV